MSTPESPIPTPLNILHAELAHVRSHWWWLLLLGIMLVTFGTAAIVFPAVTVVTSVTVSILLGVALLVSGIAIIIGAFWAGKWSGFLLSLLVGVLYSVAGVIVAERPLESTALLTLFLASMFIVLGIFRIVAALSTRFPHWGWVLLNGVVTLVLGILIYRHFPADATWVIGMLVGIEMLFNGWTWIMLALAVRPGNKSIA